MSEKNPWLRGKNHSGFLDGSSSGWPDWDSSKCRDHSGWPSWEIYRGNKDIHKDGAVGKGAPRVSDSWSDKKQTEHCNSEISERNPWLRTENRSSSLDNCSRGWPDWDSSKSRDHSGWPSWEIYQGSKDIHKDDAVGKGAPRVSDSWSDKKQTEHCNSEISERNPWLRTENRSSSLDNCSRGWSAWDTGDSPKCNKYSEWPSWESLQGNKDLHKDDPIDRGALTISDSCSGEQRDRGRVRKRSSRDCDWSSTTKRDENSWERKRSRSREKYYSRSRNGRPFSSPTQASCVSTEAGSDFGMKSRPCRDFAAGKCVRGSQCRFAHNGFLEKRERNHLENQLEERSRITADYRGALQYGDYKRSADSLRDISNGRGKCYEEDESRKNTICCKHFLRGKCYRGSSCRYFHAKAAGEDYHKGNEGSVCDQNVKSLAKRGGPAGAELGGRSDYDKWEHSFDVTKSWNDPKWDNNGGSPDIGKNKACLDGEKPWKPKWSDEASFPDEPKATGWGHSSARTTYCRDPTPGYYRTDESKLKDWPEWSEKLSDKSKTNGLKWDNDGGSVVTGKNIACSEDYKKPCNGPTWGDEASFPDEPKASGWGDSFARTTISRDPAPADYRTDESKPKGCLEWSEKLSDRSIKDGLKWDNDGGSVVTGKNRACSEDEKSWGPIFPDEPKATGWGDSSARTTNSYDTATAHYRSDESKVRCPEWSETLSDRSKKNGPKWDNDVSSLDTRKKRVFAEDKKQLWDGPARGDEAFFPDEPKSTGWSDSASRITNSHDPAAADYRIRTIGWGDSSLYGPQGTLYDGRSIWTAGHIVYSQDTSNVKIQMNNNLISAGESNINGDMAMMEQFKYALSDLVKEIVKPAWKRGKMSKEVHNAMVRKVVHKVLGVETERDSIPKTQEQIDLYLDDFKPCITIFVKQYMEHYGIQDELGLDDSLQ